MLPLTREWPAAIASAWLLGAAACPSVAAAIVHRFAGDGAGWPRMDLAVKATLAGELSTGGYVVLGLLELGVLAGALWATALWWRSTGPGAQFGVASRGEVDAVLGAAALRRRRKMIRPDLGVLR